jgi:cytochrome c biogenesis protein ResB
MKKTTFSLLIITIITLITATILEKLYGTPWVASHIYGSTWFLLLWALLTISAIIYIIQRRLYRRPLTLLLHLSFVIILIGAAITHYFGINGQIHLRLDEAQKSTYIDTNYQERNLPFAVSLNDFQLIYYPGTTNPMDFVSYIKITDYRSQITDSSQINNSSLHTVSMNNILSHRNYRFYQSSYDSDHQGSILSIYHDPYGITITYIGYFLLFASMTLFLLNKYLSHKKK